jgi:hypothetical protein
MKLKPGFYMEDDGTVWLVYPCGRIECLAFQGWQSTFNYKRYVLWALVSGELEYIGL